MRKNEKGAFRDCETRPLLETRWFAYFFFFFGLFFAAFAIAHTPWVILPHRVARAKNSPRGPEFFYTSTHRRSQGKTRVKKRELIFTHAARSNIHREQSVSNPGGECEPRWNDR